jgi:transposase
MRRLTFTETEAQTLSYERFYHSHPRVRRKMEVLWLKSQGFAHKDSAQLVGVSGKTLRSYLQQYVDGGIEGLKELHFRQPQSELLAHQEAITTNFSYSSARFN